MKRKARIAAAVVLAFLPIFGLLGCGESEKFTADDLVLIHTVYYGTERNPVYCFALKKEENRNSPGRIHPPERSFSNIPQDFRAEMQTNG